MLIKKNMWERVRERAQMLSNAVYTVPVGEQTTHDAMYCSVKSVSSFEKREVTRTRLRTNHANARHSG